LTVKRDPRINAACRQDYQQCQDVYILFARHLI
jgi:hypothetical protein